MLQKLEQQAGAGSVHEFQKVNGESGREERMLSCGSHELVAFEALCEYSLGRDRPALVGDLMSVVLGPC